MMKCAVCGSINTNLAFIKKEYNLLRCAQCNHIYTDTRLTEEKVSAIYSDYYFTGSGNGYDDYTVEKEILVDRGEYNANKLNKFMIPRKVLDI
jgi:hypothetical protein